MSEVKCKNCGRPKSEHNHLLNGDYCANGPNDFYSVKFEPVTLQPTPAVEVSGGLPLAIWMEVKIDETLNGNQIRCSAAVYAALTHFMSRRAAKGGESNG